MSDEEIKQCLRQLNTLVEAAYPDLSGKVKITRVKDDRKRVNVVGNESGIICWSLAMASAVIFRAEMKYVSPYEVVVLDGKWFTQDSELKVAQYLCNEDIVSKQDWHESMVAERERSKWSKSLDGLGCAIGLSLMIFVIYCVISTIVRWI